MNTWTWKNIDYNKAKEGDIVQDASNGDPTYIEALDLRKTGIQNLITPEIRISTIQYCHQFDDSPDSGYSLPCFKDGSFPDGRTFGNDVDAQAFFEQLKNDPKQVYKGIKKYTNSFTEPAVIRCVVWYRGKECGASLSLDFGMTNTCERCGTDYNGSGQLLAPREQWGEDTGETVSDILSSDWRVGQSFTDDEYDSRFGSEY